MKFDDLSPRAEHEQGITAIPSVVPVEANDIPMVQLVSLDTIPLVGQVEFPPSAPAPRRRREPSLGVRVLFSQALLPPNSKPPLPGLKWRLIWALPMLAWSFLWGVAFLLVNVLVSLLVIVVTILINCVLVGIQTGDYRGYLDSLLGAPAAPPGQVARLDANQGHEQGAIPGQEHRGGTNDGVSEKPVPKKASPYTPELGKALMPAMLLTQLALVFFGVGMLRLTAGKDWPRKVGLRRPSITQSFIALLGLPGLMMVATAVHAFSKHVLPGGNYQQDLEGLFDSWPLWFGVLAVGLGPGLCEELWCRGFLGRGLVGRFGFLVGMLVVSLWFGAMHIDPPHIAATAVMGFALHYSYVMTRSLWVPMFLHTVNNSTGVLMTKWSGLRDADPSPDKVPAYMYAAAILLLGAVAYALYRSRPRLVAEGDQPLWQPGYPGMEHPPAGSGTVVHRPWPGWLASGLVVLAVGLFAGGIGIAVEQEKTKGPGDVKGSVLSAFLARPF